jgi:hypothetical protein
LVKSCANADDAESTSATTPAQMMDLRMYDFLLIRVSANKVRHTAEETLRRLEVIDGIFARKLQECR